MTNRELGERAHSLGMKLTDWRVVDYDNRSKLHLFKGNSSICAAFKGKINRVPSGKEREQKAVCKHCLAYTELI